MREENPGRVLKLVLESPLYFESVLPTGAQRSGGICFSTGAVWARWRSGFLRCASHGKAVRGFGRNDTIMPVFVQVYPVIVILNAVKNPCILPEVL